MRQLSNRLLWAVLDEALRAARANSVCSVSVGLGSPRSYAPLDWARCTLRLTAVPQEAEIPAADQRRRIARERDDGGSQRGCLPGFGRHAPFTEKHDADLAVARACGAPIGGLHHHAEPLTLIRGHPGVARDRARLQHLPEPLDRFDPTWQVIVERKQDGHRPGVGTPCHIQKWHGAIRAQDTVAPLLCFRLRRQIRRNGPRQRWTETWDLAQKYGARIGVR